MKDPKCSTDHKYNFLKQQCKKINNGVGENGKCRNMTKGFMEEIRGL